MCFGGYVNGSRVDEVIRCKHENMSLTAEHICGGEMEETAGPAARASVSVGVCGRKVFMFGGQEDDNRKLNDIWCYDAADTMAWSQIECPEDERPIARSGHTTVVFGKKMYIFGGILELTHELNDLVVFDTETCKFSSNSETVNEPEEERNFAEEKSPTLKNTSNSPMKRGKTLGSTQSPTRSP